MRTGSNDVLYLLYDTHKLPKNISNKDKCIQYEHREQIIHFSKSLGSSLIVEDPSNLINEDTSFVDLHRKFDGMRSALYCITPFVSREGLLATGVEFRPETIKGSSMVQIAEMVEASEKKIKEIEGYLDGELLGAYYKKSCGLYRYRLSKCKRLFQHIAEEGKGIAVMRSCRDDICLEEAIDILREYYPDGFLEHFDACEQINLIVTHHNSHLLDAAMLHALSEHQRAGKRTTVMFSGNFHLRNITPILTQMGYRLHEHYVEPYDSGRLFDIKRALKTIEPSYDPDEVLPKTAVDYFLAYKRWEADHPTLKKFVPAYTIAVWYDYYQAWKQEESAVKKAAPIAIAGTVLAVVCALIKLCSH